MKYPLAILVVLISLLLISCTSEIGNNQVADTKFLLTNVPYSAIISLPHTEADSTIFYGENDLQFGKLWLANPSAVGLKDASPLVIFIHGGCWLDAYSINHSFPLTSALAENGVMVWSLEYRRTGDAGGGWPGTFQDVLLGIQYFLQQTQHQYDRSNVVLVGHSAGGHLALLAQNELIAQGRQDNAIAKVIGLAAISDLNRYAKGDNSCQSAVRQFMDGNLEEQQRNYELANPAQQLVDHGSPVQRFLLHGTADAIVPLSQTTEADFKANIVEVGDGGHFDWLHPQSESFQVLLNLINNSEK